LGKELALPIYAELAGSGEEAGVTQDTATRQLIDYLKKK
jgi:hypothetical protein